MKSNRSALVTLAVAVAVGILIVPLAIRSSLRCYALHRFLKFPGVRERIAVQPISRIITALAKVHPINLGYAIFDTGTTNQISIEANESGTGLILTNSDIILNFLPPFNPESSTNPVSASDARSHPHTVAYLHDVEVNPIEAETTTEETQLLPLSKIIFMSNDDFLLYVIKLGYKGAGRFGLNEVQFFNSPDAKGVVRIGKNSKDRHFAAVALASSDSTKAVGFHLYISETSSNDISGALDSILRSFHFTTDSVTNGEKIKLLIRDAGIHQRQGGNQY